jgi:hypothetical protein
MQRRLAASAAPATAAAAVRGGGVLGAGADGHEPALDPHANQDILVGQCRLTLSISMLKARMVSALEASI